MLKTEDLRDYFEENMEELNVRHDNWNVNKLDNSKRENIVFYYLYDNTERRKMYIGNISKSIKDYYTILIHWNENYKESRKIAERIYDFILEMMMKEHLIIKNNLVENIEIITNIQDVSDFEETNLYEFVIQIEITYKESEE